MQFSDEPWSCAWRKCWGRYLWAGEVFCPFRKKKKGVKTLWFSSTRKILTLMISCKELLALVSSAHPFPSSLYFFASLLHCLSVCLCQIPSCFPYSLQDHLLPSLIMGHLGCHLCWGGVGYFCWEDLLGCGALPVKCSPNGSSSGFYPVVC